MDLKFNSNENIIKEDCCIICNSNKGIYKFRCCKKKFCSSSCFKSHNKDLCNESNDLNESILEEDIFKEIDKNKDCESTITEEEKILISSNQALKNLLNDNPELIEMLKFIDGSTDKTIALASVINEDLNSNKKVFEKFLNILSDILGEEFQDYKEIYDSMIYEHKFKKRTY